MAAPNIALRACFGYFWIGTDVGRTAGRGDHSGPVRRQKCNNVTDGAAGGSAGPRAPSPSLYSCCWFCSLCLSVFPSPHLPCPPSPFSPPSPSHTSFLMLGTHTHTHACTHNLPTQRRTHNVYICMHTSHLRDETGPEPLSHRDHFDQSGARFPAAPRTLSHSVS